MILLRRVIGDALRARRQEQHRTLREVSTAANVSLGYLSEIERGQKEASSELLAAVCDALGARLSEVLREVSDTVAASERVPAAATPGRAPASTRPVSDGTPVPAQPVPVSPGGVPVGAAQSPAAALTRMDTPLGIADLAPGEGVRLPVRFPTTGGTGGPADGARPAERGPVTGARPAETGSRTGAARPGPVLKTTLLANRRTRAADRNRAADRSRDADRGRDVVCVG